MKETRLFGIVSTAIKDILLNILALSILMSTCIGIGWCIGIQTGKKEVRQDVVNAMLNGNIKPAQPIKVAGIGTFVSMGRTMFWSEHKEGK